MSSKTQLGIPGTYINLGSHVQAPKLRGQLRQEKFILDFPKSLCDKQAFEEDASTSKIGGYPNWLPPSEVTEDYVKPKIPSCKACKRDMNLVAQVAAPFDFPIETANIPLPSSCAASLGKRTRHSRTVYVFACNNTRCGNAPGSWCVMSLCQSAGTEILEQAVAPTPAPVDADDDDVSSDEEEDDLVQAMLGLQINDKTATRKQTQPVKNATVNESAEEDKKPAFANMTKNKGVALKSSLFDMGGWSDDEEAEAEEEEAKPAKTETVDAAEPEVELDANVIVEELRPSAAPSSVLGADLTALSQLLDRRDEEDRQREEALRAVREAEAARQAELQQQRQEEARATMLSKIVVPDTDPTVPVFRPFYICWQDEPQADKTDYSKEEALLKQYYQNSQEEKAEEGSASTQASGDDGDEDRYESARDKAFRKFSSRVQRQPDQCIRYWPSQQLQLHEMPKDDVVKQLREQAAKHPLDVHRSQSGMWGIHTVPDCSTCGAPLRLEMQLMPNLLNELHLDDEEDEYNPKKQALNKGMDWGIVDVYMCPSLCTPDEYVTSYCCVSPSL